MSVVGVESPLYTSSQNFEILLLLEAVRSAVENRPRLRSQKRLLVGELLLLGNGKGVDSEEVADAGDDEVGPTEVDNCGEDEVAVQVVQLRLGADGRDANDRKVGEARTSDERHKHDGPVRERLLGQVSKNHLGSEATKDEGHGQAEENEVVLGAKGRVRRVDPCANSEGEHCHRRPLQKDGSHRLATRATGLDDMKDAEGDMGREQGEDNHADPDVTDGGLAQQVSKAEHVLLVTLPKLNNGLGPDTRAVDPGDNHDTAGDQDALGRAVDSAQVQSVGVVRLPGREEHGQARDESREDAGLGAAETHGGGLEETGQGAVQRVDSVVKELAESARSSCSAGLLSIEIVHGLVHEKTEGEAEV